MRDLPAYCHKKMNEHANIIAESYLSKDFYHVADRSYQPGDHKLPGTYGKSIHADNAMSPENDPLGEYLREEIREEHYSEKPSRFKSVFVFDTQYDAEQYRIRGRKNGAIYRVKYIDASATFHRVCLSAFSMDSPMPPKCQAHEFWARPPIYSSGTEIFAESAIVIVEEVSPALSPQI